MKKNKGITLIALIITIIILIILTAVTINNVIGTDLIGFATKAVENYIEAEQREKNILNGILNGNGTEETKTLVTLTDDDIGKYVNYKPNGTSFTVTAEMSGLNRISEDSKDELRKEMRNKDQVFQPDPEMKWRLYSVDESKIVLIGSRSTQEKLYLYRVCLR